MSVSQSARFARAKEQHMTRFLSVILMMVILTTAADAHIGLGGTVGFTHGFAHPFNGLDHILAMVAVGLFAANLGGRALWLLPSTFVAIMAAGGVAGMYGLALPIVEIGIALSVIVLGAVVALEWKAPIAVAIALVGFFAIFHGHAHGSEIPALASGAGYALGFMLATASLHAIGLAAGLGFGKLSHSSRRIAQIGGGATMALAGVGFLTAVL
jgi:urease accessory protein